MGDLTWRDWQDNLLLREMTRVIDQPCETSCMGAPTFDPADDLDDIEEDVRRLAEVCQERDQARAFARDLAAALDRSALVIVALFGACVVLGAYVVIDVVRRVF